MCLGCNTSCLISVLTEEMERKISYCLQRGNPTEVLVDKFRLQITRNDISTLGGLNWLNDEVKCSVVL